MRSQTLLGSLLLAGFLTVGSVAINGHGRPPARQWAIAEMTQPTLIVSTIVQGPVLFVHDEVKMARGEPCTTVYLFEPGKGPAEKIVSFHCIPTRRPVAGKFTIRTRTNTELGFGCVLTEYQFAGDAEGHGLPAPALAH